MVSTAWDVKDNLELIDDLKINFDKENDGILLFLRDELEANLQLLQLEVPASQNTPQK